MANSVFLDLSQGGQFTGQTIGPAASNIAAPPFTFAGDLTSGLGSSVAGTVNLVSGGNSILAASATGVRVTQTIAPATTDGAALGTSTLMWSDLFLAFGGVINWDNGDVTFTHSANALTFAGGNFLVGTPTTTARPLHVTTSGAVPAAFESSSDDAAVCLLTKTDGTDQTWGIGVAATAHASGLADRTFYIRNETDARVDFTINRSTGVATVAAGTATPANGSTSARLLFGTTAGFGIYYGSGAPTVSAAKGSLYLRSDGTTTNDRSYINTDAGTTWTALTTAA